MENCDDQERNLLGSMTLRPEPSSVPTARRWFRSLTSGLELRRSVDDCALLISELVTNALVHTACEDSWLIRVEWYGCADTLRVEVHSPGSPERIRLRPRDPEAAADAEPGPEGGRGLLLVDRLADEWSVGSSPHGGIVIAFSLRKALAEGAH
jgi:anti-sigma regulatory factor (Ser/Thr protein kinase)